MEISDYIRVFVVYSALVCHVISLQCDDFPIQFEKKYEKKTDVIPILSPLY